MTTSPLPWSIANEHDIMDASGKIIGSFTDHRNADFVIKATKTNEELNAKLRSVEDDISSLTDEIREFLTEYDS